MPSVEEQAKAVGAIPRKKAALGEAEQAAAIGAIPRGDFGLRGDGLTETQQAAAVGAIPRKAAATSAEQVRRLGSDWVRPPERGYFPTLEQQQAAREPFPGEFPAKHLEPKRRPKRRPKAELAAAMKMEPQGKLERIMLAGPTAAYNWGVRPLAQLAGRYLQLQRDYPGLGGPPTMASLAWQPGVRDAIDLASQEPWLEESESPLEMLARAASGAGYVIGTFPVSVPGAAGRATGGTLVQIARAVAARHGIPLPRALQWVLGYAGGIVPVTGIPAAGAAAAGERTPGEATKETLASPVTFPVHILKAAGAVVPQFLRGDEAGFDASVQQLAMAAAMAKASKPPTRPPGAVEQTIWKTLGPKPGRPMESPVADAILRQKMESPAVRDLTELAEYTRASRALPEPERVLTPPVPPREQALRQRLLPPRTMPLAERPPGDASYQETMTRPIPRGALELQKERTGAQGIREDEGRIRQVRAILEASKGEGRPDLEHQAPGEPGRPAQEGVPKEVAAGAGRIREILATERAGLSLTAIQYVARRGWTWTGNAWKAIKGGIDYVVDYSGYGRMPHDQRPHDVSVKAGLAERYKRRHRGQAQEASFDAESLALAIDESLRYDITASEKKIWDATPAPEKAAVQKEGITPTEYVMHQAAQSPPVGQELWPGYRRVSIEDLHPARWAIVKNARSMQTFQTDLCIAELERHGLGESELVKGMKARKGFYVHESRRDPSGVAEWFRRRKYKLRPEITKAKRDRWNVIVRGKSHWFHTKDAAQDFIEAMRIKDSDSRYLKKSAQACGADIDFLKAANFRDIKLEPPITELQRLNLGMIRDPRQAIAISIAKTAWHRTSLELFRHFHEQFAVEIPEEVRAQKSGEAVKKWARSLNLEQIKGSKDRVGILHEKYLPRKFAEDINEMTELPKMMQALWLSVLNAWKLSHTVASPPTHGRNLMGNLPFTHFAGNAPWNPQNTKYYVEAAQQYLNRGPDYRLGLREGIWGPDTQYFGAEVWGGHAKREAGLRAFLNGVKNANRTMMPTGKVWEALTKSLDSAGKLYNFEDVWFKLATLLKYKAEGLPKSALRRLGREPGYQPTDTEIATEVNRWFPNYAEVNRHVRWWSRKGLGGPFMAFNEQAVRIIVGRAAKEHPLRVAMWAALPGIMTEMSAAYLGMSDDERDLVDAGRSYWEPVVPSRTQRGAAKTIDLRYLVVMADEYGRISRRGGFRLPWFAAQPGVRQILDIGNNKDSWTGRQIVKEGDSWSTQQGKRMAHFLKGMLPLPTMATYGVARVREAAQGAGDVESVLSAVAGAFAGINIRRAYVADETIAKKLKAKAMANPLVERFYDLLLQRRIREMPVKLLSQQLKNWPEFMALLKVYEDAYQFRGSRKRQPSPDVSAERTVRSLRAEVTAEHRKQKEEKRKQELLESVGG